jgi:hypothetical protein
MNRNQTTENFFVIQQVLMAAVMHIRSSGRMIACDSRFQVPQPFYRILLIKLPGIHSTWFSNTSSRTL